MDKKLKTCVFGAFSLFAWILWKINRQMEIERKKADKYEQLYKMMTQWMEIKQNGLSISKWLIENKYYKVAIYGLYLIGERLYTELSDEKIDIVYGIDSRCRSYLEGIRVYRPMEQLPQADIIIVTAVAEFEDIRDHLQDRVCCPVLSFRDILDEVSIS